MSNDEIESFYFKETLAGVEHDYRITQNNGFYGVERDGEIIAELQMDDNEQWVQATGVPLALDVVEKIGRKIEDHYD